MKIRFQADADLNQIIIKASIRRQYQKLMEDLHDLAVVAERRDEAPVALEEVKRRLNILEAWHEHCG
jgi:hypothetical protein